MLLTQREDVKNLLTAQYRQQRQDVKMIRHRNEFLNGLGDVKMPENSWRTKDDEALSLHLQLRLMLLELVERIQEIPLPRRLDPPVRQQLFHRTDGVCQMKRLRSRERDRLQDADTRSFCAANHL